ncbi:Asp/Glu/hydantoin racemase [Devosia enhydra]|uniref:Asp/Glu/hydantoin racemase n=1 Tax=Devosia enhydra TaxID=665118 RepID=A0A1K2I0M9_9HYPH|nr:aspartate/glutamate racemase family protein [Devosia enhydra]SFZ85926.1 Asp/Glu/hydantoin racemase [Devosia enhydra]
MPNAGAKPVILVINPNISPSVSASILDLVRDELGGRAEARLRTAPFGFGYISTHTGLVLAAHAVLEVYADYVAEAGEPDAVIIACFGDPAVQALREIARVPVIGFAEAGFRKAALGPGRFLVATSGAMWLEVLRQLAFSLDLIEKVSGFLALEGDTPAGMAQSLSLKAAASGAASIVLGGAGLIPTLPSISALLAYPVIDPHRSAVEFALGLIGQKSPPRPTFALTLSGVSRNLTRLLAAPEDHRPVPLR